MNKGYALITMVLLVMWVLLGCNLGSAPANPETAAQPTAVMASKDMPGWEQFNAGTAQIWLPDSFDGGDLANDLDLVISKLNDLGPEYEAIDEMLQKNRSMFFLWVFDTQIGESGALTNVNIVKEKVLSIVTLDVYMDAVEKQLPSDLQIQEKGTVNLNGQEVGRLIMKSTDQGISEAMYLYKVGNEVWILTYATGIDEFESRLADFEKSAGTFSMQP